MTPQQDRARLVAPALLAAVAGSAAVGIAALAREGLCVHRLAGLSRPDLAPMPGMTMDGGSIAPCPILVGTVLVAAALYLFALVAIALVRPSAAEVALATARLVLGIRFAPLAALLVLAGAVPLGAALVADGHPGAVLFAAAAFVVAAALVAACALRGAARFVVALARRLAVAFVAAFRLLVPGADAPWVPRRAMVLVPAGVRLARRRPSRAPPLSR